MPNTVGIQESCLTNAYCVGRCANRCSGTFDRKRINWSHDEAGECHLDCSIGVSVRDVGREEDIPELGGRGGELNGDEGAFGTEDWRTNDVSLHFFLGLGIFHGNLRARGQAFRKNDHGAIGADGVREAVHGIGFSRQMNQHRHPEQNTLGAAAFLRGLRTRSNGAPLHRVNRRSGR